MLLHSRLKNRFTRVHVVAIVVVDVDTAVALSWNGAIDIYVWQCKILFAWRRRRRLSRTTIVVVAKAVPKWRRFHEIDKRYQKR